MKKVGEIEIRGMKCVIVEDLRTDIHMDLLICGSCLITQYYDADGKTAAEVIIDESIYNDYLEKFNG